MSALSPSLESTQRWLLQALIAPARIDHASIEDRFLPGALVDARACLAIYQRSYILRLRKCLARQFPATRYALGDAVFDEFADASARREIVAGTRTISPSSTNNAL